MKFKGGGGRIPGQAVTPALHTTWCELIALPWPQQLALLDLLVLPCQLWLLAGVCPRTDGRAGGSMVVSVPVVVVLCPHTDCELWECTLILFALKQKLLLDVIPSECEDGCVYSRETWRNTLVC